jgi:poly-gamma-glutamate synthesis protein (capsule biosynthesis protein)
MLPRLSVAFGILLLVSTALLSFVPPAEPFLLHMEPPPRTTVVAVGDILLGRSLGALMEETGDYTLPFTSMKSELASADITFGNLEGPFCGEPPYPTSGMVFRVHPAAIAGLVDAGFKILSVANNHFENGGDACMRFSLEHLREAGIATAGAGVTYDQAHAPAILVRHRVRFAFLGYTYALRNDIPDSTHPVIAGRNPENVRRDVAAALRRADAVIVSLHDGAEYTERVAAETVEFAHAAIDAGAAVVLGHHPHVPQRIEHYRDGWIFYSLGNFVFQQYTPATTRTALAARLTFAGARLARVEALPVEIEWHSHPRLADTEESARILKVIGLESPLLWPPEEVVLSNLRHRPTSGAISVALPPAR